MLKRLQVIKKKNKQMHVYQECSARKFKSTNTIVYVVAFTFEPKHDVACC